MTQIETYTFWQLITKYTIEIPIVQRDYAQGRNDAKSTEIRTQFLKDLHNALDKGNTPIELDFVYGKVEKKVEKKAVFIPIDGQQRLTTLFLLHVYLAAKIKNKDLKSDCFSYKTRISARDFCAELIANGDKIVFNENNISANIKNASWFFLSWKKDPSVQAMLRMLDAIEAQFRDKNIAEIEVYWSKLTKTQAISFKFLNLDDFDLTDELYLKMNARGQALSDFEKFKAWLIGYVDDILRENELLEEEKKDPSIEVFKQKWNLETTEIYRNWKDKIDINWTDLFWQFKDKDNKIDAQFVRFFIEMGLFEYAKTHAKTQANNDDFIKNIQELTSNKNDYSTQYFEVINCFNLNSLNFIFTTLDVLIIDGNLIKNIKIKAYFDIKKTFEDLINNKISYSQRVYFYAFISFIQDTQNTEGSEKLFNWMRFVRNIIENTTIDAPINFASAIKAITELSTFKTNILSNLTDANCDKIPFFGTQIKEEKLKADLIKKDINWRNHIVEAENHPLFKGNISFLLPDKENSDLNVFIKRKEVAMQLFDKDGATIDKGTNLLGRTLLSLDLELISDKELWLGGKNNQYWKDHLKDTYYIPSILKAIDLLVGKANNEFAKTLENRLKNIDELPVWKRILIKNPILFEKYTYFGKIQNDGRGINLYESQNFNERTNAISIKNNRNDIITELIDNNGFELITPNCKRYANLYTGDIIELNKGDIKLKFDRNKVVEQKSKKEYDFTKNEFINELKSDFPNLNTMKKQPLKALLVSNGIEGLDKLYVSNDAIHYDLVEIDAHFNPDLSPYDVLIAPNGTDHVAFYRIKESVKHFLDNGGTLLCCDGWFTNWIPNNRWIMDNSKRTMDVRYRLKDDPFDVAKYFNVEDLIYSNGISGWWACGYIEPAPNASVLIEDTWGRPLVVIDDSSTNGLMILTASGLVADLSYATTDDNKAYKAMTDLFSAFIHVIQQHHAANWQLA